MDKYTIYCTEEQTTKAIELGAPIIKAETRHDLYNNRWCFVEGIEPPVIVPTAEQMLGWLEEQGIFIEIGKSFVADYQSIVHDARSTVFYDEYFPSRQESTLAAIDAALEYLTKIRNDYEIKKSII